jgi:hypothetical protein
MTLQDIKRHRKDGVRFLVDAHVHIHDCFDVQKLLDAAADNFAANSCQQSKGTPDKFVLCLTETRGADRFGDITSQADTGIVKLANTKERWQFKRTDEEECLIAAHPEHSDIAIVAGRQIVTAERLEILALGTVARWPDGLPASDVVASIIQADAIPILPWGFGKWLGRRRNTVERLIEQFGDDSLYLGDNSGRPGFISTPAQFLSAKRIGMKILPGSDPLPFSTEYNRAGSFGFYVDGVMDNDGVWSGLYAALKESDIELHRYGSLESPYRFVRNQIAMQYLTRIGNRRKAS